MFNSIKPTAFALILAASCIIAVPASAALKLDYKKGVDPDVTFQTGWTKKGFVRSVRKYLQNNSFDDLAGKFAATADPSANYNPFTSRTWLDAKYGSDLRLFFRDQKNVFVIKHHGKRLFRFNGPDDAPVAVPGPEAGVGLAGLAMAGFGAYALRRRRQQIET